MDAEAQSEESGRKMVMRVRTLEDMAGNGVKYWRMEHIAIVGLISCCCCFESVLQTYQE